MMLEIFILRMFKKVFFKSVSLILECLNFFQTEEIRNGCYVLFADISLSMIKTI